MRTYLTIFFLLIFTIHITAQQSPTAINYQGVARDLSGNPLPEKTISLQISILQDSSTGIEAYKETHNVTTSNLGLFNIIIGRGNVVTGELANLNWGSTSHYLQLEIDTDGGSDYNLLGTSELISVPYALYASNLNLSKPQIINDTTLYRTEVEQFELINSALHINNRGSRTGSAAGIQFHVWNDRPTSNNAAIFAVATDDFPPNAVGDAADLTFMTEEHQNRLIERMRITSKGNVGIGNDNPQYPLSVKYLNGVAGIHINAISRGTAGKLLLEGGDQDTISWTMDAHSHSNPDTPNSFTIRRFNQESGIYPSSNFTIDIDGNVGIGDNNNPKSRLQVSDGDIYIEDITSGVIMKSPNGQCWRMRISDNGETIINSITCPN